MGRAPIPLFPSEENFALATDLYELTMAAGYLRAGMTGTACFELFVRDLPPCRSYLVVAGLEQAVHYLERVRFSGRAIDYLRSQAVFAEAEAEFFEYLRGFRFRGDLSAMPEGTVAFPGEPLLLPVLRGGKLIRPLPTLHAARERAARSPELLPPRYRRFDGAPRYPVRWSRALGLRISLLRRMETVEKPQKHPSRLVPQTKTEAD